MKAKITVMIMKSRRFMSSHINLLKKHIFKGVHVSFGGTIVSFFGIVLLGSCVTVCDGA